MRLHIDQIINYIENQVVQEHQQTEKEIEAEEEGELFDDFYSDFSDDDYRVDEAQEREQIDLLYNLLSWINSNTDINFS